MKSFIFLTIFSFLALLPFQNDAQGLLIENRIWSQYNYGDIPFPFYFTEHYKIDGDTIIAGLTYKKYWSSFQDIPVNWSYNGLIRENDSGQVYIRRYPDCILEKLFDFSLNVGDSTIVFSLPFKSYVILVDSVNINNVFKKRIYLSYFSQSFPICDIWVKDIGSLCSGIKYSMSHCSILGSRDTLLCISDSGLITYQNQLFNGCYFTNVGINELKPNKIELLLTPNPITDNSFFKTNMDIFGSVNLEITNQVGLLVKNISASNISQIQIQKSDFTPGMYFYRLFFNNRSESGKFIVQY